MPSAGLGGRQGPGGTRSDSARAPATLHSAPPLPTGHFGGPPELPGGLQALQGRAQSEMGSAGMSRDRGTETLQR